VEGAWPKGEKTGQKEERKKGKKEKANSRATHLE
jgi:hypothetical protein